MKNVYRAAPLWCRLSRSSKGNISIIFAAFIFVIGGVIGLAVDYARSSGAHAQLQAALDSAVLAAARRQASAVPGALASVEEFVQANFNQQYPDIPVKVVAKLKPDGFIVAGASITLPTTFMRILGRTEVDITTNSIAQLQTDLADIALVLDNTFSMSPKGKLDALKEGAKRLVDIIYEPDNSNLTVRIGLVPFAQYVNVGVGYRGESWLNVPPDGEVKSCWPTYPYAIKTNCHYEDEIVYKDGVPIETIKKEVCDIDYGEKVEVCGLFPNVWQGCVGSRPYPMEMSTSGDFSTPVPGIMTVITSTGPEIDCPQPLARLTDDKVTIKNQIDNMVPIGETFIQSGLLWGWRILSPDGPFKDGHDPVAKPNLKRFLVLMTDGSNTKSPDYPMHTGTSGPLANSLTTETCKNIKAEGTFVYAIAFDVNDAVIQDLLRNCATDSGYYYAAEDNEELKKAFERIANSVVAIRLTK